MSGLVRRQDAIDLVKRHYRKHDNDLLELIVYEMHDEGKLQSASQEAGEGQWKWVGFNIECSKCGAMPYFSSAEPLYKFCPNCGCAMVRGDKK